MQREPRITEREEDFRAFMRSVNKLGGGIVFEAMSETEVDAFMKMCATRAGLLNFEKTTVASGTILPQIAWGDKPDEDRPGKIG
jgi:hypothetical protein